MSPRDARLATHLLNRHTFSHPDLGTLTNNEMRDELAKTQAAIESAICVKPKFLRPPYGSVPKPQLETLDTMGYKSVTWTMSVGDWQFAQSNRQELIDRVINASNFFPRSVIHLQHDWYEESVATVGLMVDIIKSAGFKFVTMDECAYGKDAVNHASSAFSAMDRGCSAIPGGTAPCQMSEWSAWGPCNSTCSEGSKTRTRLRTSGTERSCFHIPLVDTQRCVCCYQRALASVTQIVVHENTTAASANAPTYTLRPQCELSDEGDRMVIVLEPSPDRYVTVHSLNVCDTHYWRVAISQVLLVFPIRRRVCKQQLDNGGGSRRMGSRQLQKRRPSRVRFRSQSVGRARTWCAGWRRRGQVHVPGHSDTSDCD